MGGGVPFLTFVFVVICFLIFVPAWGPKRAWEGLKKLVPGLLVLLLSADAGRCWYCGKAGGQALTFIGRCRDCWYFPPRPIGPSLLRRLLPELP